MSRRAAILFVIFATVTADCPKGTIFESTFNKCYKLFNTPSSFVSAELSCIAAGGHLVAVANAFENAYISGLAAATFPTANYWIGANLLLSPSWSWTANASFTYSNWMAGVPQDPSFYQCGAVKEVDNFWSKELCYSTRPFICQIDPDQESTPTPTAPLPTCSNNCSLSATCDPGYTLYRGNCQCYKYNNTYMIYNNAASYCSEESAHLAFISSADENDWIMELAISGGLDYQSYALWIGLVCPDRDQSHCFWQDGTPLTGYTNFESGQPNGSSNETYLDIDNFGGNGLSAYWSAPVTPDGEGPLVCQKASFTRTSIHNPNLVNLRDSVRHQNSNKRMTVSRRK